MSVSFKYALRVDVLPTTREKLDTFLTKHCEAWIVAYEEAGDNKHIHAIIDSHKKDKDLRNALRLLGTGNRSYSLKQCTDDYVDYIRYICKGVDKDQPPVIWTYQGLDYSEEVIREAHDKYWVTNEAYKENASKRRKLDSVTVVEALEKLAKEKGLKGFDRVGVANLYISMYVAARKPINLYSARAVVNTVCCVLDLGDQARDSLASRIADI